MAGREELVKSAQAAIVRLVVAAGGIEADESTRREQDWGRVAQLGRDRPCMDVSAMELAELIIRLDIKIKRLWVSRDPQPRRVEVLAANPLNWGSEVLLAQVEAVKLQPGVCRGQEAGRLPRVVEAREFGGRIVIKFVLIYEDRTHEEQVQVVARRGQCAAEPVECPPHVGPIQRPDQPLGPK